DPNGIHHTNTGALETDDWLYISSLHADNLARISKDSIGSQ
ncbi:MAG: SMP-30/gluconolactonase/LRE family protein, partial [Porticoccaceae bacterium]|nr:SMP-30/gluconolactonase/LRE family protein [Porticoccaceae bacterium]